jgi:V/A-type H+-transporting ATPase subunit D
MAHEYKLNKSELTRIKRQEKLFLQYLPVLKLKQEQLQSEQNRIKRSIDAIKHQEEEQLLKIKPYTAFFSDSYSANIYDFIKIEHLETSSKTIAGIFIKTFKSLSFKQFDLPYFDMPPWFLEAMPLVKDFIQLITQLDMLKEEEKIIKKELRKATQKVNLFEMILIPQSKTAIKRIKIALGDEQVASVSRGKIAKQKNLKQVFFEGQSL